MKEVLLTQLRDRNTSTEAFRAAADQLALILAAESGKLLPKSERSVETPFRKATGTELAHTPVLVPILRSGLALLEAFLRIYPSSAVGFFGIRRDETTALPHLYYSNLPRITVDLPIFLLDPMLATGQSAALAVKLLKEAGAAESKITLISIIAAPEGVAHLQHHCPSLATQIVHVDEQLNKEHWIVPGLGDFGDRYFET